MRAPRGFTLVEIIVALAVGAVVVLGARLFLETLSSVTDQIVVATHQADADANGERLLRSLVLGVETGIEDSSYFQGDEARARFNTWCSTPGGWLERCRVALIVEAQDSMRALIVSFDDGTRTTVLPAKKQIELRYLADARQGGTWFIRWGSGPTTPEAIGIVRDTDTLIVRIGERG